MLLVVYQVQYLKIFTLKTEKALVKKTNTVFFFFISILML